jgi:hypothetical protein
MKNENQYTCCYCQGQLMPLWKNSNWFCIECKQEQAPIHVIKETLAKDWTKQK